MAVKGCREEIKSLSRYDLEKAYFRLLKVSRMKTDLIRFIEKQGLATTPKENGNSVIVKCHFCNLIIPASMNTWNTFPACDFGLCFKEGCARFFNRSG